MPDGRVVIDLDLDAREVKRGAEVAERSLRSVDRSADRASEGLNAAGRSGRAAGAGFKRAGQGAKQGAGGVKLMDRALDSLKTNVVIAAMAALYASFRAIGTAYRAAGVQEIADNKLAQALRNVGEESPQAVTGLKNIAAELQQVSNYGDESIQTAQAMLLSFRSVGGSEGAGLLSQSLLDLAAGMENATGNTVDLNNIAAALGKSLGSGAASLREYKIELNEQEEAAFNAAQGLDRVRLLAEIVETNYGGMARATVDDTRQLQNSVGDLAEEFGFGFRPEVQKAIGTLREMSSDKDVVSYLRGIGLALGVLVRITAFSVQKMAQAFGHFASKVRTVAAVVIGVFSGITRAAEQAVRATVAILSRLGAVGDLIARRLEPVSDRLRDMANSSAELAAEQYAAAAGIEQLRKNTEGQTKKAREATDATNTLGDSFNDAGNDATDLAGSLEQVSGAADKVVTAVDRIRQELAASMREMTELQAVPIAELVDLEAERQRIEQELAAIEETVRLGVMRLQGAFDFGVLDLVEVPAMDVQEIPMPDIDFGDFDATLEAMRERMNQFHAQNAADVERAQANAERFGAVIGSGLQRGVEDMAVALGEFAVGAASFGDIGLTLMDSIGSLAQRIGSAMIAFGTAGIALRGFLTTPGANIVAGAALVAVGSALRGVVGNILDAQAEGASAATAATDAVSRATTRQRENSDLAVNIAGGRKALAATGGRPQQNPVVNVNTAAPEVVVHSKLELDGQVIARSVDNASRSRTRRRGKAGL